MPTSIALLLLLGKASPTARAGLDAEQKIFIRRNVDRARLNEIATRRELAPLEPALGCYIGAFIANEDELNLIPMDNGRITADPKDFERVMGKRHAVYFNYLGLEKRPFPLEEATLLGKRNAAFHIALETGAKIAEVVDDGPDCGLRQFARAAASCGAAVFVRFASEMNGKWEQKKGTEDDWGLDPELYKEKFRLVANVCRDEMQKYRYSHLRKDGTPPPRNIAMVWSPSPYGTDGVKAEAWYPGKEYVDWVGVNFYSVLKRNDGTGKSAEFENPLDTVKAVVDVWGSRHPIMIAEWAATHHTRLDPGRSAADFAINKIGQLYGGLPLLFPQVKCVNYFSENANHAETGARNNDFSLFKNTDNAFSKVSSVDSSQPVAAQYQRLIMNPYYLRKVQAANQTSTNLNSKVEFVPLEDGEQVKGDLELHAYVRSDTERPKVEWMINGKTYAPSNSPGNVPSDYLLLIPSGDLTAGKTQVKLLVYDEKGKNPSVSTRTVMISK